MSVYSRILTALDSIGVPVSSETNVNDPMPYITFNCTDERGEGYSNNQPAFDRTSMQIHLFTERGYDYLNLKKQIKSALFEAGFSYPVLSINNEDDYNHLIFECEYVEGREV